MKIAIVNLTAGGLSTGYRKYLNNLIPLLVENTCVKNLHIFLKGGVIDSSNLDFRVPTYFWPNTDGARGFPWLKLQLRKIAPDVVFIPNARWLNCGSVPVVLMVQNMEPLTTPYGCNPFIEKLKNFLRAKAAKRSCKKATRVISISKFVKNFICTKWGIESEKVGTVYHGVNMLCAKETIANNSSLTAIQDIPFLFTAGSIRPARGLEDIILALKFLRSKGIHRKLVIAGNTDKIMLNYKKKLEKLSEESGVLTDIIWAGNISNAEMSWCYNNCEVFIMTSRVEACPNIVLEAMSHGCVSVSTESPPMPEFFRNTASYYDPGDWRSLGRSIKSVLTWEESARKQQSELAKNRAEHFSWKNCAEGTLNEMRLAAENLSFKGIQRGNK